MGTLIALCGPAGCGKTTAAEMFVGLGYRRLPFADPLKTIIHETLGVPREYLWGKRKESIPPGFSITGRQIMKQVGTDCFRSIRSDVWLDVWHRQFQALPSGTRVVVDDCRFPNEAELIRALGGSVVLVDRPGSSWGEHISERALADFDFDGLICNGGPLYRLRSVVQEFALLA